MMATMAHYNALCLFSTDGEEIEVLCAVMHPEFFYDFDGGKLKGRKASVWQLYTATLRINHLISITYHTMSPFTRPNERCRCPEIG